MAKLVNIVMISVSTIVIITLALAASWFIYNEVRRKDDNVTAENQIVNASTIDRSFLWRSTRPSRRPRINPLANQNDCGFIDSDNRIFNGNITQLFEFPWMARLAYNISSETQFLCAGSVISDEFILTAAHCISGVGTDNLSFVRLGEFDLTTETDCDVSSTGIRYCAQPVQDIEVAEIIPHPEFQSDRFQNDIGLIRLARPANLSSENVKRICLPFQQNMRDVNLMRVTITGWGTTGTGSSSNILQKAHLPVINQQNCSGVYNNINLTDNHICVGGVDSLSCMGDSGGPLQMFAPVGTDVRYYQYGVISTGPQVCNAVSLPNVHTRILNYLDWIYTTVGSYR